MSQGSESKKELKSENKISAGSTTSPQVRWDDSKMTNTYANVCNVSSTREEVTLLFGTNQTWHTGQKDLTVQLSNRVILNPFAAKRLSLLLNNVVGQYESHFGELKVEGIKK